MAWKIEIDDNAQKQLAKLDKLNAKLIIQFLRERVAPLDNPRQNGAALQGTRLGNLWRYRVGDYRVICDIQDQRLVVLVIEIGYFREVYR